MLIGRNLHCLDKLAVVLSNCAGRCRLAHAVEKPIIDLVLENQDQDGAALWVRQLVYECEGAVLLCINRDFNLNFICILNSSIIPIRLINLIISLLLAAIIILLTTKRIRFNQVIIIAIFIKLV